METGLPPLLRRINSELVLTELRRYGPLRVTQVVERTGLSRPTVEGIADGLVADGWVTESMLDAGQRRGRPARELAFRADAGAVLGVDIGVRRVNVLVSDLAGTIRGEVSTELDPQLQADERVAATRAATTSALKAAGVPRELLMGVTVGSPGIVDAAAGVVTKCAIIPGWSGLPLAATLQRSFRCPVTVENDANLAAVGELWRGVAQGVHDLVFVLAGERLGAGIVVGDAVVRGYAGGAGEMGFTSLFEADPGSEGIGALARVAGAQALQHLLGRSDQATSPSPLQELTAGDPLHVNAEVLFEAARQGDGLALEVMDRILGTVARAIAVLVTVLNPEMVVIGGAVANAAEALAGPVRQRLAEMTLLPTRLEASSLGHRSVALGGVRHALVEARRSMSSSTAPGRR